MHDLVTRGRMSSVRPLQDLPPAIVLGGTGAALSISRSLGRRGVEVHVLGTEALSHARASRYCASFALVGTGREVADRWLEWLKARAPRGAVVLPTSDFGVELVIRNDERLRSLGFRLPEHAGSTSLAMLDKDKTYELARSVGVDCPRTWTVRDAGDLDSVRTELSYPCALKPLASHEAARHFSEKVFLARNFAELEAGLARAQAVGVDMLVTEIIPGGDDCNWAFRTYLDDTGQPLFGLTTNRLRSLPIHFGTNCYVVTRWDPEVAEVGLHFMQSIGLRGVAYVELKRDPRDGSLKLLECNHRFGAAQEVVRRAGVDVAWIAYRRAIGAPVEPIGSWRTGIHLWFPLRDARAAASYRRNGELTWPDWLRSLLRRRVYVPVLALDDPRPTVDLFLRRTRRVLTRHLEKSPGVR